MGDITFERVDALGDYLTDEVYEVQFITIPSGFTGIDPEEINLRAHTFEIPDVPVNYLQVPHRTFEKSQPTHRANYQSASMTMVETATPKSLAFLQDWMNRCAVKGTNFVYPPSQRQCEIMIYHKRNDKTVARVYNLKNVQIETKGSISLGDGSSPAAIIPSVTFNTSKILEGPNVNSLK